jgi:hypothetical protein
MRYIILAIAAGALASACSIRSERTVVEKPVATPVPAASAVVYTDPVPATTTTVHVR